MPEISVIVPAFNAGEFLEECLRSIAGQSFSDIEVIVVDDGSSDSTLSIAQSMARGDSRFQVLSVPNGGVSRARNLGVDRANGEFITFVDADDALHPDALRLMLKALRTSGADVCIAGFRKFRKEIPKPSRDSGKVRVFSYEEAMGKALYQELLLNSPWGAMIRRSILGDKRFREGVRYEDLDAFYRFYEGAGKIAYLPASLYFYRQNPGSFLAGWSEARLDVLDVTDRIADYMAAYHPGLLPAAQDRRFSAHFNMLVLMRKNGVNNLEAAERCRRVIREGRRRALADRRVRIKNKLGALISYFIL